MFIFLILSKLQNNVKMINYKKKQEKVNEKSERRAAHTESICNEWKILQKLPVLKQSAKQ